MLGFVSRLVGERGSAPEEPDAVEERDERDQRDERDGRPPTRLYQCPDCESVYLSADLSTCESCETGVDPVPTERDLGYGSARSR